MAYTEIIYDVGDRIATITLNRPDRLNAWTGQMDKELRDALGKAKDDDDVRVIILTGAGRGFCAGADMGGLSSTADSGGTGREKPERPSENGAVDPVAENFEQPYTYFPSIPKPIIAAINGPCAGLGLVISLFADIRFASDKAKFTTAFAARGLIAEHGLSWMLPKLVGISNAMDLTLSARKFMADEALRLGLVSRVFENDKLMDETRAYAAILAETVSPRSTRIIKQQIWGAQFQSLARATQIANYEMHVSLECDDFKEGVAHFVEKRAPAFTGK